MPGITRRYSGPNGFRNYIPDNVEIELTRNPAFNIIRIDLTGPNGQLFHRIITRNVAERITDVGFWVED